MSIQRGKLIVIEGCDGAGKETQAKMLLENLKSMGKKVVTVSFPRYDDTVAGRILKYILKSEEGQHLEFSKLGPEVASLYYVADRRESKEYLESLLLENNYVILDRYFTANLLHQGAKFDDINQRKNFIDKFTNIELMQLGIAAPDLVLYLSLPYEISIKRMEARYEKDGGKKDQVEADNEYIKRSCERGEDIAMYANWNIVSGAEMRNDEVHEFTREEIQAKILKILNV